MLKHRVTLCHKKYLVTERAVEYLVYPDEIAREVRMTRRRVYRYRVMELRRAASMVDVV
jgi:hypothetical protein